MRDELREEVHGPLTTYTDYLQYAGYEIEITATRVADERIRAEIGSEWSVNAVSHERPELAFDMNQTDLDGVDDPRLVIARAKEMIRTYLDENYRTADSVTDDD